MWWRLLAIRHTANNLDGKLHLALDQRGLKHLLIFEVNNMKLFYKSYLRRLQQS